MEMEMKICICTSEDVNRFDKRYNNSRYKYTSPPKTIHWHHKSDGSFEAEIFEDEDLKGDILCRCGKYMKTHIHEHSRHDKNGNAFGRSWHEMIAVCSCDNPKPYIMTYKPDNSINESFDIIISEINKIKSHIKSGN